MYNVCKMHVYWWHKYPTIHAHKLPSALFLELSSIWIINNEKTAKEMLVWHNLLHFGLDYSHISVKPCTVFYTLYVFWLCMCVCVSHRPCTVLHCRHPAPGCILQWGWCGAQLPSRPGWRCCSWCSISPTAGAEPQAQRVRSPLWGEMNQFDVQIFYWRMVQWGYQDEEEM